MTFHPGVASLAHLGTHPRLHITPSNLATYRTRFASGDMLTVYSQLVDLLEDNWTTTLTQWFAGTGVSNINFYFPGDLYAFVYLIGAITGDGHIHTPQEFGQKAAEHLVNYFTNYGTAVTLAASGTTVTVTGAPSTIATNDRVCVFGASDDAFNGFFRVSVPTSGTFTYTATRGTPPATGTAYVREHTSDPQYVRWMTMTHLTDCYDWLCGNAVAGGDGTAVLSDANRAIVVKHLMDMAEEMRAHGSPNQTFWVGNTITRLHSSPYTESHQIWYPALACWNEQSVNGIADRDTSCQTIMDHWETTNLYGAGLDAYHWAGRESPWSEYGHGGGTDEVNEYTFDRCIHFDMCYNGMRTACNGMNYLTTGSNYSANWLRYAPHLLAFMTSPHTLPITVAPYVVYPYLMVGQGTVNEGIASSTMRRPALRAIAGLNSICGYPKSAGLAKWLLDQMSLTVYPTSTRLQDALIYLLTNNPDDSAVAAADVPLPHLYHLPTQGVFIRTAFGSDPTATIIHMGCPEYFLFGHSWDISDTSGTGWGYKGDPPRGLMIYKHGPLLVRRGAYLRGNTRNRNHLSFVDPAIPGYGWRIANAEGTNVSQYTPTNASKYIGGATNIYSDTTNRADLVEATLTGLYNTAIVSAVTSKWIVFRGADSAKDDYIIEYTSCTMATGKTSVTKRWTGNCPYAPTVDGAGWVAEGGSSVKWVSTDGSLITIDNRNWEAGDPVVPALTTATIKGRLFVKPLMPTAKKLYLRGGRNFEFMDEAGSSANPPAGLDADIARIVVAGQLHCGSHFFHIEATESNATERFLICFQASDSSVVTTAKTMDLVTASNLRGAHIQDATNGDKVAIFSYDGTSQTSYSYTITMSAVGGTHLVSGLDSTKSYIVRRNGTLISPEAGYTASRGALCFTSLGGTGTFTIEQSTTARRVHLVLNS